MNVYSEQQAGVLFWRPGPVPGAAPVTASHTVVPGWKVYADQSVIVWPIKRGQSTSPNVQSRAGNQRWWAWHESPVAKRARAKVIEKLRREEIGILEPEIEEQIADSVASVLEALPQEPPAQGAKANVSKAEVSRIVRQVFEEIRADIREEEDDNDATWMLLQ